MTSAASDELDELIAEATKDPVVADAFVAAEAKRNPSVARELWDRAQAEISATCDCPKDGEHHASKVRDRYLELWRAR